MFKILHTPRYSSRLPADIKACIKPQAEFIGGGEGKEKKNKQKTRDLLFVKFSCIPL